MTESKKHHYVPRSLLRGFAIAGSEKVHVYDKKTDRAFKASIADVAAENRFNLLEVEGRPVNAESAFNNHDTRLAELLRKLRDSSDLRWLTANDRVQLAYAAVVQRLRVKLIRTTLSSLPGQLRQVLQEAGMDSPASVAPDLGETAVRAISFRLLQDAEKYVPAILNKDWILHHTSMDNPYWISDSPIVTVNILPWGGMGLESRGVEIAWPISSTRLLSFLCPSHSEKVNAVSPAGAAHLRSSPTISSNAEGVLFYNSLQVLQSSRYLYGATADFSTARRIIEQNPNASHIETTMEPTGLGRAPNRRMPPGDWLVVDGAKTHHCLRVESSSIESNRMTVVIAPESHSIIKAAVADGPHEQVRLYRADGSVRGLRQIRLAEDLESADRIVVVHDGPPL